MDFAVFVARYVMKCQSTTLEGEAESRTSTPMVPLAGNFS